MLWSLTYVPASCPVCSGTRFELFLNEAQLRRQAALRNRFVAERLQRMPSAGERKDLTEFAHNAPACIYACAECGLLMREEQKDPSETYVEDSYDFAAIEHMLPRYVEAFRAKQDPYRAFLSAGSRALEIGPHLGGFLQVAGEWGWHPEGIDIGRDTSAYLVSKGYTIHDRPIEQCGFAAGSYDGIFIWNCFDQIADPRSTLTHCRQATRNGGCLVLRTPNGRFYAACESLLTNENESALAESVTAGLGYENLLAFPYLYGYDSATLERIAGETGYEPIDRRNSELIISPFPEVPAWMALERRTIQTAIRNLEPLRRAEDEGYLIGPWLEMSFRAA